MRISDYWAVIYFGQFFKALKNPQFFYCKISVLNLKNRLDYILADFFIRTHLVTLKPCQVPVSVKSLLVNV
jgi:hypothetical protein